MLRAYHAGDSPHVDHSATPRPVDRFALIVGAIGGSIIALFTLYLFTL